ncbi:hypothetical protein KEM56_006269 [Ascosphaera pollenicola]|nr:hypothetical protein KEM56_006269 [Ascosphaera pollenicola]
MSSPTSFYSMIIEGLFLKETSDFRVTHTVNNVPNPTEDEISQFTALTQNEKAPVLTKYIQPAFVLPKYSSTDKEGYTYAFMYGLQQDKSDPLSCTDPLQYYQALSMPKK